MNTSFSLCPKCGNFDRFTESERQQTVFCQRCYHPYDYKEGRRILINKLGNMACERNDEALKKLNDD